ncbi:host cell division inhibitor Icd-like protein [Rodentibacter pneumotropicus]|nr:host cell division inhibitor Icd-like protein [Rodentibacter pneumotropicus]
MKNFQIYSSINECFNHSKLLQSAVNFGIISTQSQKMTAEPENSKNKTLANTSTPLKNRAFFVRSTHTPQEIWILFSIRKSVFSSMVERNRQPLVVGCFPVKAVSHPVRFYRQIVRSLAVVLESFLLELTQMYQFIFAAIRRTDLTNHIQKIRINADSELQARAVLAQEFVLILAGKINLKNDRTLAEYFSIVLISTQGRGANA